MTTAEFDPAFTSPLEESLASIKRAGPCILTIFGATGDLTARKLLPALYNLAKEGQLPSHFACVGFARRDKSHDDFRKEMYEAVSKHSRSQPIDDKVWEEFSQSLFYHKSEFQEDEGYDALCKFLKEIDRQKETQGNRVFYLSTPPSFFPMIAEKLKKHELMYNALTEEKMWSRIIIEKPFGRDLESAEELQDHIETYMHERQIYRIDHYLGKETVQNLLVFRFSNSIFEDLWNSSHIDHVQISVAEDIGIGTRGKFFEEAGILRDIVQNHVMQLLSLIAMEPPISLESSDIHDEKVKVLKAIRAIPMDSFDCYVARGQYDKGIVNGSAVKGYREEKDVSSDSNIETFVALKLFIDNWRWANVPFYLRAGKCLPKKTTEVVITFKSAPGVLFQHLDNRNEPNRLVIRIQPNEGMSLRMNCKVPGMLSAIQPVKMDFRYGLFFGLTPPEAYERLICDCMAGDSTLFARNDEVLASWKVLTPILERWKEEPPKNFPNYPAGSWGPDEAREIMERDGRSWHLI